MDIRKETLINRRVVIRDYPLFTQVDSPSDIQAYLKGENNDVKGKRKICSEADEPKKKNKKDKQRQKALRISEPEDSTRKHTSDSGTLPDSETVSNLINIV